MSITRGLKAIREAEARREAEFSGPKTTWFKIKDGQSVRVRFLDDLDPSIATEAGAGVAAEIKEHQSPVDFRRKIQCTRETRCWACEYARANPKGGWGQKTRVYYNVLINDGVEDPYVAVWSTGIRRSPIWETLVDTFVDDGSIANREWRVKRSGAEKDNTTYTLRSLQIDDDDSPFDFERFERFDLDKVIRTLPYEEQENFLMAGTTDTEVASTPTQDSSEDWV